MTMTTENRIGCGSCGAPRTVHTVLSTHSWGSPDLDFRAPPEARYLLDMSVQACEFCGYCAGDLARPPTVAQRARLLDDGYRQRLSDPLLPVLACRFRAAAELIGVENAPSGAARWLLAAAWACDDEIERQRHAKPSPEPIGAGQTDEADPMVAACAAIRVQAAAAFERAMQVVQPQGCVRDDEWAVMALQRVDALRRAGRFDVAASAVGDLLALSMGELSHRMADTWEDALHAQRCLVQAQDVSRRTLAEAAAMQPAHEQLAAKRRDRDAEHRRQSEAEAERRRVELAQAITPERCLDRIAALLADRSDRPVLAGEILKLPMPTAVCHELAQLAADEGWPAAAVLAGIGLGVLAAVPGLARRYTEALPRWRLLADGEARMTGHLAHVFRRCTPKVWHYWPPEGQRVFED
jgi:hypothetical protein